MGGRAGYVPSPPLGRGRREPPRWNSAAPAACRPRARPFPALPGPSRPLRPPRAPGSPRQPRARSRGPERPPSRRQNGSAALPQPGHGGPAHAPRPRAGPAPPIVRAPPPSRGRPAVVPERRRHCPVPAAGGKERRAIELRRARRLSRGGARPPGRPGTGGAGWSHPRGRSRVRSTRWRRA